MKTFKERIGDLSSYLQSLMTKDVFPDVQDAVERNDKDLLVKACKKAQIPEMYLANVVSLLLSVGPDQKWPGVF